MNGRRLAAAVTVILLLGAAVCAERNTRVTAEQVEKMTGQRPTEEEVRRMNRLVSEIENSGKGRFILKGEVVDEQGKRLEGVRISIRKSLPGSLFNWEGSDRYEQHMVDGVFALDFRGYSGVTLVFAKGGYYKQEIDYGMIEMAEKLSERIARGEKVSGPVLREESIRVVLEKQGEFTILEEYEGTMEYGPDGRGVVYDFGRMPKKEFLMRDVDLGDPAKLPQWAIYMTAEREGARLRMAEIPDPPFNRTVSMPAALRLITTDPEGGFIRVATKGTEDVRPLDRMRRAPESEYEKEVMIPALEIPRTLTPMAFYVKIKGMYGKGVLMLVRVEKSRLLALVRVYVQKDGLRNLETLRSY